MSKQSNTKRCICFELGATGSGTGWQALSLAYRRALCPAHSDNDEQQQQQTFRPHSYDRWPYPKRTREER
jgi:hypothetical protein